MVSSLDIAVPGQIRQPAPVHAVHLHVLVSLVGLFSLVSLVSYMNAPVNLLLHELATVH